MSEAGTNDELSRLVGDVAVEGARAEFALRMLLVGLIRSPYAEIIAAGRTMSQMIDDCKVLIKVHLDLDDEQRAKPDSLLTELKGLQATRNRLVHSMLAVDQSASVEDEPPALTALYGQWRQPGLAQRLTIDEIRQVPQRFKSASDELILWTFSHLPGASEQQVLPPNT